MSRTYHKEREFKRGAGKDYWSRRYPYIVPWVKYFKTLTHRLERRINKHFDMED